MHIISSLFAKNVIINMNDSNVSMNFFSLFSSIFEIQPNTTQKEMIKKKIIIIIISFYKYKQNICNIEKSNQTNIKLEYIRNHHHHYYCYYYCYDYDCCFDYDYFSHFLYYDYYFYCVHNRTARSFSSEFHLPNLLQV